MDPVQLDEGLGHSWYLEGNWCTKVLINSALITNPISEHKHGTEKSCIKVPEKLTEVCDHLNIAKNPFSEVGRNPRLTVQDISFEEVQATSKYKSMW